MIAATEPIPVRNLQVRIASVRRKRLVVRITTGAAFAAALLTGAFAAEGLLDSAVELPWMARAVVFLGTWAGAAFLLWGDAIRPLRKRMSDDGIASMIEHALPEFRTRFIASLQLARAAGAEAPHAIVRALVAETEAMAARLDFRRVVRTARLKRALLICFGVLAAGSLLAWCGGSSSVILLKRAMLFNTPLPRKTQLLSVTGDKKTGVGEDVKIEVTASGILPPNGQVIVTNDAKETRQFTLDQDPARKGSYETVIRSPQESFSYYVKLNDATSAAYRVETILRPAVAAISCEQTYPAYVNLPPVKRAVGDLGLLAGSRLKIAVKATRAIAKGELRLAGLNKSQPLEVDPKEPSSLSGEIQIPPKDLTGFSVHLVDTAGVESAEGATYRIDVTPDHAPVISITFPTRREELATPQAVLRIGFEAKDDFGVVKAVLHYTIDQGAAKTIDFDLGGRPQKEVTRRFDWKLASLQPRLTPGNVLEYWIEAADGNNVTGPGVAASDHYQARIVTEDDKRADMANRLRDAMGSLGEVTGTEEELNKTLGTAIFEKPKVNQ